MMYIKKVMRYILGCLNQIYSDKNIIIFNSCPEFWDNNWYIYKYIIDNNIFEDYEIIWLTNSKAVKTSFLTDNMKKRTKIIYRKSIKGILKYINAKYVFLTIGLYTNPNPGKKIIVNFGHGMPIKTIAGTNKLSSENKYNFSYMVATSELFAKKLATSYGINEEKVLVVGQPKNDGLFIKGNILSELGIKRENYKKVIMWLPTYRVSKFNESISEGGEILDGISFFDKYSLKKFDLFLRSINSILVIKIHPLEKEREIFSEKYDNIKFILHKDIEDKHIQINELITECDGLLTDYSSVYVDYLLLDRPIGFVMDDLEAYRDNRGLLFKATREWFPGSNITSESEMREFLIDIIEERDKYKKERSKLNDKFNTYKDGENCRRFFEKLNECK